MRLNTWTGRGKRLLFQGNIGKGKRWSGLLAQYNDSRDFIDKKSNSPVWYTMRKEGLDLQTIIRQADMFSPALPPHPQELLHIASLLKHGQHNWSAMLGNKWNLTLSLPLSTYFIAHKCCQYSVHPHDSTSLEKNVSNFDRLTTCSWGEESERGEIQL